jgi:PAS domain S-box-containing protein
MYEAPDSFSLFDSVKVVRELMKRRLEEGGSAAQGELEAGLQEIEALWEELRGQALALAEERQRYAEFFDYAPDAYLVTDAQGDIREANRAAAELLETPVAKLRGLPIASFVAQAARPEFRRQLARTGTMLEGGVTLWRSTLAPRQGPQFEASFRVRAMPAQAALAALCWLVRREN